jgi:hypothetical protein
MGFQNSSLNLAGSSLLDGIWSVGLAFGWNGLLDFIPPFVGGTVRVGDVRGLLGLLPVAAGVAAPVGPGSKVLASNFPFQSCWENFVLIDSEVLPKDLSNWSFRLFETLKLHQDVRTFSIR